MAMAVIPTTASTTATAIHPGDAPDSVSPSWRRSRTTVWATNPPATSASTTPRMVEARRAGVR